jgi:hypothetical protein
LLQPVLLSCAIACGAEWFLVAVVVVGFAALALRLMDDYSSTARSHSPYLCSCLHW